MKTVWWRDRGTCVSTHPQTGGPRRAPLIIKTNQVLWRLSILTANYSSLKDEKTVTKRISPKKCPLPQHFNSSSTKDDIKRRWTDHWSGYLPPCRSDFKESNPQISIPSTGSVIDFHPLIDPSIVCAPVFSPFTDASIGILLLTWLSDLNA